MQNTTGGRFLRHCSVFYNYPSRRNFFHKSRNARFSGVALGRTDTYKSFRNTLLRDLILSITTHPRLKPWAILRCPSGTRSCRWKLLTGGTSNPSGIGRLAGELVLLSASGRSRIWLLVPSARYGCPVDRNR